MTVTNNGCIGSNHDYIFYFLKFIISIIFLDFGNINLFVCHNLQKLIKRNNVPGKIYGRILNERLMQVSEKNA